MAEDARRWSDEQLTAMSGKVDRIEQATGGLATDMVAVKTTLEAHKGVLTRIQDDLAIHRKESIDRANVLQDALLREFRADKSAARALLKALADKKVLTSLLLFLSLVSAAVTGISIRWGDLSVGAAAEAPTAPPQGAP